MSGKGMTMAEFLSQTTQEQRNEIYNASASGDTARVKELASGVGGNAQTASSVAAETERRVREGSGNAVRNGTTLPEQSQPQKSAYNPMEDIIMTVTKPKTPQRVTVNAAFDAWHNTMNTLANERKEKEAQAKAEAEQKEYKQLQAELDRIDASRAYVTTTEQSDELEKERKQVVERMREMDGSGTSTEEQQRSNSLENTKLAIDQGLTQVDHRIAQTVDWLFGGIAKEGKALLNATLQSVNPEWGFEDEDPFITKYNKRGEEVLAANEQEAQSRIAEGTLNKNVWQYAPQVVAAVPDAVLALMSGGSTAAAQASTKALTTAQPIAAAVKNMASSPMWLSSFAQSAGSSYNSAIAEGATEEQASLYALLNGVSVATIEVGGGSETLGGIQKLPQQIQEAIKRGDSNLILKWVKSIASEAGEEVAQGLTEKALRGVYTNDVPLYSTGDENAVINPARMKEEAISGAIVSAILGGGQMALQAGANGGVAKALPTKQQTGEDVNTQGAASSTVSTVSAESRALVETILESGRVNTTTASVILSSPQLTQAFTELTGIELTGSTANKRAQLNGGAREYAYSQLQAQREESARTAARENLASEMERQNEQLAALSQEEAARDAEWTQRREEMENYGSYDSYVRGIIRDGCSFAEAGEIARTPKLRAVWERITGQTLPDTVNKARDMVMNYRSDADMPQRSAQQPQTSTETQEGNSTPAAPANVKQDGFDELNSAPNVGNRDVTADTQKNTASTEETGNEDQSVISKMRGAKPQLEQMQSISSVTGNEIGQNGRIVDRLMNFVDRIGGKVARPGFGDVQITRSKIKSSMIGHGVGNAKIEIFAAVPDVIANGQEIDHQANWKGRNYDTYVFAAPVDYRGQKTYVGVVVQKDSASNRYYLHEVLGEDGEVIFKNDTAPAPTPDGTSALSGDLETVVSAEAVERATSRPGSSQKKDGITGVAPAESPSERYAARNGGFSQADGASTSEDFSSDTSIPTTARNVKGENGVKSDLGAKSPRSKTSQTAETISEADITSDERAAQLNKYVQKGRFDYVPDTNERQTRRAEREIAREGWKKSAEDFHDDVIKGVMSDDLVARGAVLLNNISNSDATAEAYLDVTGDYIDLLHRAGKVLQAGKIVQQLTPEGRLYLMEKTVRQINRTLTTGQKKSIAKEQLGKAYDRKTIRDTVDYYGVKLDEGLVDEYLKAKTDKQRNEIISQMQQNIADQIPTTFSESFTALRYLNMLGNLKTQERNIIGNTTMLVAATTKNRVKAVGELTANLFRENKLERTASIIVAPSLLKEATADYANVADIASGGDKHLSESRRFASEIEDKRTIFKVNGTWGKNADSNLLAKGARKAADAGAATLEGARKLTNWAMEAGDAIFLRANYADALGGWLQAHGIESISEATPEQLDRGRAYAIKEAQEATFRDSNVVSNWVSKACRGQGTPAFVRAAGEGIAPFRKTPANVAVRAVEYSPIGVAETIYKGVKAAKGEATANDVINSAAKNVTGSALAVAGYLLAKAGLARGEEDDEKLDAFQTMQGKQDYSIRVGNKWISISQLAPLSIPFFTGVKFYELADGGQITLDDTLGVLGCITDPMLDMSMLSGVNEALDAVSSFGGDSDALPKLMMNAIVAYLSQGITSTLLSQFEQASEENRQTNYSTGDSWFGKTLSYTWSKMTAKMPGIDYNQQDYVDAWGRTQSNGNIAERIADAFVNPFYSSKDKTTHVDAELERIYAAGKDIDGFPNVFPQKASRSMQIAKGQTMTSDEYVQYSKERGSKSLELVRDFMESDEYKLLSDEQRAEVISDLYSLAADRALKNIRAAHNIAHTTNNKYQGVSDENMAEYLATDRLFTDAKESGSKSTYNALDDILSRYDKLPEDVQNKLESKALNVEKLLYADNKGIDSEEWYTTHAAAKERENETGSKSNWVTAEAIGATIKGSDEDKLKALEAEFPPNDDSDKDTDQHGKRQSIVRRYNAAINEGVSWDDWTAVERAISESDASWGAVSGKYSVEYSVTKALREAGYSKSQASYIWYVYEKANKETDNFSMYDYFFVDSKKEDNQSAGYKAIMDSIGVKTTKTAKTIK